MRPCLSSLVKRLFVRERSYVAHDDGRKTWLTCGDCGRVIYVGRSGVFEGRSSREIARVVQEAQRRRRVAP